MKNFVSVDIDIRATQKHIAEIGQKLFGVTNYHEVNSVILSLQEAKTTMSYLTERREHIKLVERDLLADEQEMLKLPQPDPDPNSEEDEREEQVLEAREAVIEFFNYSETARRFADTITWEVLQGEE